MFTPFSKLLGRRVLLIGAVGVMLTACSAASEDVELASSSLTPVTSAWSAWTTDGAPAAECPGGSLANGARCRGRYCDDVALSCGSGGFQHGNTWWTDSFTDGDNNERVCAGNGLVTGLSCSGRYCDNVSLRCTEPVGVTRGGNCYWSAWLSEEDGGTFEFPKGKYMAGARCDGRYCDNMSFYLCDLNGGAEPPPPPLDTQALAAKYAPRLRFDQQFGTAENRDSKCFPGDPATYFQSRRQGADSISLCNQDYSTIENAAVPTHYSIESCGTNVVVIRYWFFYAWQSSCVTIPLVGKFGHHAADWESVAVKIVDGQLSRVAFYQHGGWYTRERGNFELADGTHPVSYVGKNAHGDFHDSGGKGGCMYWDDFRNPGDADMHMDTWRNLAPLHRDASAPEWMNCSGDGCFDGIGHPLEQNGNLCGFGGCNKDGCGRSDVGGNIPF